MSTIDIKEKIQDYLEIADDNILEAIYTLLSSNVGHKIDIEAYNKDIDESLEDYKSGNVYTSDEMKKMVAGWKK
ncbi:MAG: hypothetical protein KA174_01810 [Chitinophagales bacterium]|nr:hypothetical protein [Saprospirales bacterium]MBP6659382.1 hypothetical protein [Chitinophagales bacterium]